MKKKTILSNFGDFMSGDFMSYVAFLVTFCPGTLCPGTLWSGTLCPMLPNLGTFCPGTLCPGTFWPGFDKFTYYISLLVLNHLFNKFTLDLVSIRHKVNTSLRTTLHKHFHLVVLILFINIFQCCQYIVKKTSKADVWCITIGNYH